MPTLTVTHEAPLELIRQHPDLAVDLARTMTDVAVPDDAQADLGPTSLTGPRPTPGPPTSLTCGRRSAARARS